MHASPIVTIALLVFSLSAGAPNAAPYTPNRDDDVLERLAVKPLDPVARQARYLQASLKTNPRNLDLALRLAQLHIERARSEADPRQLGYAEAALTPWWNERDPPVPVRVLRATIRQSNHQFAPAAADLAAVLERDPRNAQAWLTRATVQQVTGDLAGARASCERLRGLTLPLVVATCQASVQSLTGNAQAAYTSLHNALGQSARAPVGLRVWTLTLLAEIAERLGQVRAAEEHFRAALALDPSDTYLVGAYGDFLLDQERAEEVARTIPADTRSDPLLLRRVLALHALHAAGAESEVQALRARLAATRARGDAVHLREEARFALRIDGDGPAALRLAQADWAQQKEPADARILLEAALAAGDRNATAPLQRWLQETRIESVVLSRLAREAMAGK